AQNFADVFLKPSLFKNVLIVVLIGSLGIIMKKYDFLANVNDAILHILAGKKAVMHALPAVIGLRSVPGGAQLSAPFVKEIGEDLGVKPELRAVLNLTCRHLAMLLVPTSNALLVIKATVPEIDIYFLILLDLGFVILMQTTCYFFYTRRIKDIKVPLDTKLLPKYIKQLLIYLSPIYMILVFNGIFKVDMLISVLLSFVIIFAICGRKDAKDYVLTFAKGLKFNTFVMMVGLFFIQNTIKSADSLINGFSAIFAGSQGIVLAVAIFVFAVIISVTTGLSYTSMGIIMPILMALNLSITEITIFGFFVFASSFCGYFFSPLHLCQLLTIQTMGCSPKGVYKEYAKLMPCLVIYAFALFFIYQAVLL
ncbi:MAG: DUF401 family protein, partial [Oscillospiraceae bacterium]|nr:DUF401 family protein [Oscillospiraceae bacterium]